MRLELEALRSIEAPHLLGFEESCHEELLTAFTLIFEKVMVS